MNVHYHTLAVQGVFVDDTGGGLRFVPNPAPSEAEVETLLLALSRRITRLVKRHGIDLERPQDDDALDPLASESPLLAGISGASVFGRVATGGRAGQMAARVGRRSDATLRAAVAERQAHFGGFDLHAGVAVPAGDRQRLEHLCRYVLRPPIARDALELTADGKVLLKMRRAWHDGTWQRAAACGECAREAAVAAGDDGLASFGERSRRTSPGAWRSGDGDRARRARLGGSAD